MTRLQVKDNGSTPYEYLKGREYRSELAEIGENIHWKLPPTHHGKLEDRWRAGVFLGRRDLSDEILVGTPQGVETARSMRRRPEEERFGT